MKNSATIMDYAQAKSILEKIINVEIPTRKEITYHYVTHELFQTFSMLKENHERNKDPYPYTQIQKAKDSILHHGKLNTTKRQLKNKGIASQINTGDQNRVNALYQKRETLKSIRNQIKPGNYEYQQKKQCYSKVVEFLHEAMPNEVCEKIQKHTNSVEDFIAGTQSHNLLNKIDMVIQNSLQPPIKNL